MGTTVFEGPHYHRRVRFRRTHRINRSADLRSQSLIRGYADWLGTASFQCRLYSLQDCRSKRILRINYPDFLEASVPHIPSICSRVSSK
jgi:hypothetical protein